MALIHCSECGRDVSDRASSCPQCGNPIAGRIVTTMSHPADVQTVEATGKSWKAMQAFGVGVILVGTFACMRSISESSEDGGVVSALFLLGGFGLFAMGRIGAWWNHG